MKSLIEEAFNKPLQGIVGAGSLITTGLSVLGFSQDKNEPYGSHFSTGLLSVFPARVIAFMIIAGSIAWTISLVGIWLTSVNNEVRKLFAHLVTAFGALFMAACIEWIFQPDISKSPVIVLLFSIIGVAFGIFLAKTNFRLTLEPDPEVIAVRAGLLMNFAMVATALVILVQLTGLS
ncbi:hypothetical protein [Hoeflea sp. AS16]|uniref:hypothetical protein n=1 Tax=Hoeflea sp. AS16 TaxID=3135779 RepID=UPI003181CF0F